MTETTMRLTAAEMKKALEDRLLEIGVILENHYHKPMPIPSIEMKSLGLKGGTANRIHNRITLNSDLCAIPEEWIRTLSTHLPHEFCHLVAPLIYNPYLHGNDRGQGGWSHGRAWKECMRVIGLEPDRCFELNETITSQIRKREVKRDYVYVCPCGKHFYFTAIKHNRIQRGQGRICRTCKGTVTFMGYKA